ncbi:MAG: peroxide stress protein YaaA [Rhodococcus sp. (in: high G+C Gram-positive bacteria)]
MLVLLPPSETKSAGGHDGPLDLEGLWLPELTEVRSTLVDSLVALSDDMGASRTALGLSPKQDDEIARNAELTVSATRPALERYTGVLFDALGARTFTRAQQARARSRIAIGSALFGAVRAHDLIPAYRLSGGSSLPGLPTLRGLWKPHLADSISAAADGVVVDLRSGAYRDLGPIPGAITATVLTEQPDGSRTVVSHFNKHHKGLLARALTVTRAEPSDARAVATVARKAGLTVEVASPTEVVVVTS